MEPIKKALEVMNCWVVDCRLIKDRGRYFGLRRLMGYQVELYDNGLHYAGNEAAFIRECQLYLREKGWGDRGFVDKSLLIMADHVAKGQKYLHGTEVECWAKAVIYVGEVE